VAAFFFSFYALVVVQRNKKKNRARDKKPLMAGEIRVDEEDIDLKTSLQNGMAMRDVV
jgi:hypothetical protein